MMKFRVLLISEDPATAKMVHNIIRHHRHLKVEETTQMEEGLAVIQSREPFHILLSDLAGQGARSIHLLGQARSRSPDTRLVVLTGFGDHQLVIDAIKAGAHAYLHKPFRPEELNLILNNLTSHFQQIEKLAMMSVEAEQLKREIAEQQRQLQELEHAVAELRTELRKHEPEQDAHDFQSVLEKAAQDKTGITFSYNVSRELTHLTHLLEERKINPDEYTEFRRSILEKAYQTPLV